QCLAPVRVRWAPLPTIPRRVASVADRLLRPAPRPQLDQHVQPGVDVEGAHIRPDVPQLLFGQPLDLLQVVEVLFDAEPVRGGAQDLFARRGPVGADQGQPAVPPPPQPPPDHTAGRPPRRQEGLDRLGAGRAVLPGPDPPPAAPLPRPLDQADAPG